jgi:hypothetical protein
LPKEGIFIVDEDDEDRVVAGACMYPAQDDWVIVAGVVGEPAGVRMLLRVLEGHCRVACRYPLVDMAYYDGPLEGMKLARSGFCVLADEPIKAPAPEPPSAAAPDDHVSPGGSEPEQPDVAPPEPAASSGGEVSDEVEAAIAASLAEDEPPPPKPRVKAKKKGPKKRVGKKKVKT